MPTNKHQILPQNLLKIFYQNFSIYPLLLHFHSVFKNRIESADAVTFNFSAFLTLDKSRNIIRKKEDQFVLEMIQKIEQQVNRFTEKNADQKELYKITYAELEKFIQLFESRRGQFSYFQKALVEIENALNSAQKEKRKHQQTIQKMKDRMDDFHEKLILLLHKYQQKMLICYSSKLKSKPFRVQLLEAQTNQSRDKNSQDSFFSTQPNKPSTETNSKPIKRSQSRRKTLILAKFGDISIHVQNIGHFKQEIMNLKTKYHKMVCKTEMEKKQKKNKHSFLGKDQSKTHSSKVITQEDVQYSSNIFKDEETNFSDVKYSIRLTQSRKKSKISSSFSIFSQASKNASFFLKSGTKFGPRPDSRKGTVAQQSTVIKETSKNTSGEFLRKRSSLLKNLNMTNQTANQYFQKKPYNSVYRQTNFAVEAQQRKPSQRRVSTAKRRDSIRRDSFHKSYFQRVSQTQGNVGDYLNQQEEGKSAFCHENSEEVENYQQDTTKHELSRFHQEESENDVNLIDLKFKNKSTKNRRNGFTKKNLDFKADDETTFIPSTVSIQKKSSLWNQNIKPDKPYNRTSFFRSSGYTQQKPLMNAGKTRFNTFGRKPNRHDSKSYDPFNESMQTQKSILGKGAPRDSIQKGMKFQQMAINASDFRQLYQEITAQAKIDQSCIPPSYFLNMMRQKYDLKHKSNHYSEFDDSSNPFMNQRFLIVETDPKEENSQLMGKWTRAGGGWSEVEFAKIVARKHNELGQKNLDLYVPNLEDGLECISL